MWVQVQHPVWVVYVVQLIFFKQFATCKIYLCSSIMPKRLVNLYFSHRREYRSVFFYHQYNSSSVVVQLFGSYIEPGLAFHNLVELEFFNPDGDWKGAWIVEFLCHVPNLKKLTLDLV
ncbi:hypothetical protein F3Y22_tig00001120pilonHSYRG00215 [Hibiscus syriacus]|uniref:Uncharacterized protein n=1 Tax=Hibiscus syriacus TaxID=106335 RepID=A0A6A3D1E3_HIBSY|nr:hypothetical protein F3Y22_tig00001120pilonHSYRG00215 [Hibiscus syriacus]